MFFLSEGFDHYTTTSQVLKSMEIVSRSRIQKTLPMSSKFSRILQGLQEEETEDLSVSSSGEAPTLTKGNVRALGGSPPRRRALRNPFSSSATNTTLAPQRPQDDIPTAVAPAFQGIAQSSPPLSSPLSTPGPVRRALRTVVSTTQVPGPSATGSHLITRLDNLSNTDFKSSLPQPLEATVLPLPSPSTSAPEPMSISGPGSVAYKGASLAGGTNSSLERKVATFNQDPNSARLFESIGISPQRFEFRSSATSRLNSVIQSTLSGSPSDITNLYVFSSNVDGSWTCRVNFRNVMTFLFFC